jgi:hypothetical protein
MANNEEGNTDSTLNQKKQKRDVCVEPEKNKKTVNVDFSDEEKVIEISNFVVSESDGETDCEDFFQDGACNMETPTFKVLPPNIPKHLVKGNSKLNPFKGKQPLNYASLSIEGDLVPCKNNSLKRIYELTEESIRIDRLERARATLKTRIRELHQRNLYNLSDVLRVFYSESIPLSLKIPIKMTVTSLSTLLLIEESSSFIDSVKNSFIFQDLMRKYLLEEKNLPVCRCGYIYIHPSLTYSKHPNNPLVLIGNLGDVVSVEKKTTVLQRLNSLRVFLENLYEYLTTTTK